MGSTSLAEYCFIVYVEIRTPLLLDLTQEERQIWGAHIPARLVRVLVEDYQEIVIENWNKSNLDARTISFRVELPAEIQPRTSFAFITSSPLSIVGISGRTPCCTNPFLRTPISGFLFRHPLLRLLLDTFVPLDTFVL